MPNAESALLFDTHAWIWLANGHERATPIRDFHGAAFLSAISVWEIGLLAAKRRVTFEPDVQTWTLRYLPLLTLLPFPPQIALLASHLPGEFHADPADCIIMASALFTGARLATADKKMLRYATVHD